MRGRFTDCFTIFLKITVVVLLLSVLLSSCAKKEEIIDILNPSIADNASELPLPVIDEEVRKDLVHLNLPDLSNIHPLEKHSLEVDSFFSLIFDRAIRINSDGSFSSGVIESWEIGDDGKKYILHVRDNVYFHDESLGKVTSRDIEFALNYIIDEENESAAHHEYASGIEEITARDESTLVIKLSEKKHNFMNLLNFFVVPSSYYKGESKKTSRTPVGTGAYKVNTFEKDYYVLLEVNDRYWKKKPAFDRIEVVPVPEEEISMGSKIFGEMEMIYSTSLTAGNLGVKGKYNLNQIRTNILYCLILNVHNIYLEKKNIRKAVSYGIDRTDIVREAMMGLGEMTYTPLVETYYGITNRIEGLYSQNIKESLVLLKREGLYVEDEEKETLFTLRLAYEASPASYDLNKMIAEEIRTSLKNLKIEVELMGFEGEEAFQHALDTGNFHMALCRMEISDDYDLTDVFTGLKGHYSDSRLKEALSDCRKATTEEEVKEAYTRVHEILVDDMPIIGLFFEENALITNDSIVIPEKLLNRNTFSNISDWTLKQEN